MFAIEEVGIKIVDIFRIPKVNGSENFWIGIYLLNLGMALKIILGFCYLSGGILGFRLFIIIDLTSADVNRIVSKFISISVKKIMK